MPSKHTPGPWHIGEWNKFAGGIPIWAEQGAGAWVAVVSCGNNMPVDDNAQLICASPNLLETCEALLGLWERTPDFRHRIPKADLKLIKKAKEAIAKAELLQATEEEK